MFWSRPSISSDTREWVLACFDWFEQRFPTPDVPILPTKHFFRGLPERHEDRARMVLEDIQKIWNLDLDINIEPIDSLSSEYRQYEFEVAIPAGTFEKFDGHLVIRYDPELSHQPISFINIMAHELMHARLSGFEADMPGGEELHELATDLACIICGFGVIQLLSADELGWVGYLRQETRAFALAVFLDRRHLGEDVVDPFLTKRCRKYLRRAFKDLNATPSN